MPDALWIIEVICYSHFDFFPQPGKNLTDLIENGLEHKLQSIP